MITKILYRLFPQTMARVAMVAHGDGWAAGHQAGYDQGVSYGISLVPGHMRLVMRNLEDANADRARG